MSWSWWLKITPKISLASRGQSRLTGPWDRSRLEDEEVSRGRTVEREKAVGEEKVVHVREQEVALSPEGR